MASVRQFPTIKSVRSFIIDGVGSGVCVSMDGQSLRCYRWQNTNSMDADIGEQVATTTMSRVAIGVYTRSVHLGVS